MPGKRRNQDKFENYDKRKQFWLANYINASCQGLYQTINWEDAQELMNEAAQLADDEKNYGQIYGIRFTDRPLIMDYEDFLQRYRPVIAAVDQELERYTGPFKEIKQAESYISNPKNGDLFELIMEQPLLANLLSTFGTMPVLVHNEKQKREVDDPKHPGQKIVKETDVYVMDPDLVRERQKILGEMGPLLTDFYTSLQGFIKVQYDRQKAEREEKSGLDTAYAMKYAEAIDQMIKSYDALCEAHRERYQRTDLSKDEKELKSIKGIRGGVLEETLSSITAVDPEKVNRNGIETVMEYYRAQSKAIKNGWSLSESVFPAFLAQAAEDMKVQIKGIIPDLSKAEGKEKEQAEAKKQTMETAVQEASQLYKVYAGMKKPGYFERRDAAKATQAFMEKYGSYFSNTPKTFEAIRDRIQDPLDYQKMSPLEQTRDMFSSLDRVDKWLRSSKNFGDLKDGVEKLAKYVETHPNMTEEQFRAYEKQTRQVRKLIKNYLDGKNAEAVNFRRQNPGHEITRSEYTSRRINAVEQLSDKLDAHLEKISGAFTKEYTGNAAERAMAKYERITKEQEEERLRLMSSMKHYLNRKIADGPYKPVRRSFYKSVYVERMKERFEHDPSFSAYDFAASLEPDKILEGGHEVCLNMRTKWGGTSEAVYDVGSALATRPITFKQHLMDIMMERLDLLAEDEEGMILDDHPYKTAYPHISSDEIPGGMGQDWVRFELQYFRDLNELPGPEEEYGGSESSSSRHSDEESHDASELGDEREIVSEEEATVGDAKEKEGEEQATVGDAKEIVSEEKKADGDTKEIVSEEKEKSAGEEKEKSAGEEKKEEKEVAAEPETKDLSLPRQILKEMTWKSVLTSDRPKEYDAVVKAFQKFADDFDAGKVRELPMSTKMVMAKYLDRSNSMKFTEYEESFRREVVQTAFDIYNMKPEKRDQIKTFEIAPPKEKTRIFGPEALYHGLYAKKLYQDMQAEQIQYQKEPEKKSLQDAVIDRAYKCLMFGVAESVKFPTSAKMNQALDAIDQEWQRDVFRQELPQEFREKFEARVLAEAKKKDYAPDTIMDLCDETLAEMPNVRTNGLRIEGSYKSQIMEQDPKADPKKDPKRDPKRDPKKDPKKGMKFDPKKSKEDPKKRKEDGPEKLVDFLHRKPDRIERIRVRQQKEANPKPIMDPKKK